MISWSVKKIALDMANMSILLIGNEFLPYFYHAKEVKKSTNPTATQKKKTAELTVGTHRI